LFDDVKETVLVSSPDETPVPEVRQTETSLTAEDLSPAASAESASGADPAPAAPVAPSADTAAEAAPVTAGDLDPGPTQRISAHLGALSSLDSRPLAEHADVYQRVHTELQSALAEIDGN
jgi:hypothetical protein